MLRLPAGADRLIKGIDLQSGNQRAQDGISFFETRGIPQTNLNRLPLSDRNVAAT